MTAATRAAVIHVDADLRLEIGGSLVTVTGSGRDIRVHADSPVAVLTAVSGAALPAGLGRVNGPRALGRVADGLRGLGLEIHVHGPTGDLLALGGAGRFGWGQLLTGSSAVRVGAFRAVTPLARGWLGTLDYRRPASLAGLIGTAVAAAVVLARRTRRR